jgi:hypothetical protein
VKNRRIAVVGALIAAGLGLTACTTAGTTPGATPTTTPPPTLSPTDALTAALGKLKTQGYDLTLTQQGGLITGGGSVDASKTSATLEQKGTVDGATLDLSATQIGTTLWVKIDAGPLNSSVGVDPTKWMLVDQTKVTGAKSKTFDLAGSDALDISKLLASTSGVTRTDATHLSGTVDLTAATGVSAPDSGDLSKAADAAKKVPFVATLDDQGNLTDLTITADVANKALSEEFKLSNFGSQKPITAPAAADVVPAPDLVYTILNAV